ncbi:UNVERIFIED_CONTAM: putative Histone-lysine N-methyltransferase ATXR5 [Sesamum latifolium]|uniref:[histone H3]-lysine(27) N-methyltransferase n=1 Tax=Sesamum latifolium TaxID=2727402 RepID=A0AAW2T867_9LAMI
MPSLRRRTLAPEPVSPMPESRKRSKSMQEEEEEDYSDVCCEKCGRASARRSFCYVMNAIADSTSSASVQFLLLCPKAAGSAPLALINKTLQTKIVDFFRIQRCSQSAEKLSPDCRKRRKRNSGLVMAKKRRKLLPFNPTEDPVRRLEQMASLATALTATGTEFSNELTYIAGMAPRSANRAVLERDGMQVISKDDAETLDLCKNMMERGEWPPLMVVFDPREGFTVEADRFIRDLTIITEYVGDVDYLKNRENDDGDSMMTLLTATHPSKSLVICPDKRSNIARFINGINNHIPGGKKKQNVKCVRFNVNGECRVLLIASRDIRKGERLYYDYNGYENEYPTEHFV